MPNKFLAVESTRLSEWQGWMVECNEPLIVMALHIHEENRCIDIMELSEQLDLPRLQWHTQPFLKLEFCPQHQHCLEALVQAAVPLTSVICEALQEIIKDVLHFLEKQRDMRKAYEDQGEGTLSHLDIWDTPEPFEVLQEAVNIIWVKLSQLEEAPACIPPCGYQPDAHVFQCATCRLVDCHFPLDCPVQDMWAHADEAITLHCDVPFAIPPDLPITWMFAKDLHTQDLALFEELQESAEGPLSLTLQDPTLGTIACHMGVLSEPLVRKYFYLNVSEGSMKADQGLQAFRAVLCWPHNRTPLHHMTSLGLGLALGSMALVLLLL
ncbi:LOW QUALITY PROTEIN: sperm acrosome membrane-associated protein 6 [Pluvialis apricaria]